MTRRTIWLLIATGLLGLLGANAHLVYVAITSQPDCVDHVRPGAGTGYGAARSACTPQGAPVTAARG